MKRTIDLGQPARDGLAAALRRFLQDECAVELERFDAVRLVDFVTEQLGPHYYNQGLRDAQAAFAKKAEQLVEGIYELELPARP